MDKVRLYIICKVLDTSARYPVREQYEGFKAEGLVTHPKGIESFAGVMLEGPNKGETVHIFGVETKEHLASAQVTCQCSAYLFPHRKGSGRCKEK